MDEDLELARKLQYEEDLIANDSLLATFLHEEMNASTSDVFPNQHNHLNNHSDSNTHQHQHQHNHINNHSDSNIHQHQHQHNHSIDDFIIPDEEESDESDTSSWSNISDVVNFLNPNPDETSNRGHLTNPLNRRTQSHPLAPCHQEHVPSLVPRSILNGLMGPRRFATSWHPYLPLHLNPTRNYNQRNQMRRVETNDYEALWNIANELGDARPRGLNASQLNQLPTTSFAPRLLPHKSASTGSVYPSANNGTPEHKTRDEDECRICICNFERDEELRILPCMHQFHSKCIDQWLKQNAICPVCRIAIKEQLL